MRNFHICVRETVAYADIIRIYAHKNDRLCISGHIMRIYEKYVETIGGGDDNQYRGLVYLAVFVKVSLSHFN